MAQATAGGTVQNRSYGLYAAAPAPGWAGYFEGNVYVTGQVIANGVVLSSVQAPDGSTRSVHSMDATESVIEDFGEATLGKGQADVKLDPDFAAVVDGGAYQVFLTPVRRLQRPVRGDQPRARVLRSVECARATRSSATFGYRVVAKRRGATGKRLERVERPKGLAAKDPDRRSCPRRRLGTRAADGAQARAAEAGTSRRALSVSFGGDG